jgi:hypothetical protein
LVNAISVTRNKSLILAPNPNPKTMTLFMKRSTKQGHRERLRFLECHTLI